MKHKFNENYKPDIEYSVVFWDWKEPSEEILRELSTELETWKNMQVPDNPGDDNIWVVLTNEWIDKDTANKLLERWSDDMEDEDEDEEEFESKKQNIEMKKLYRFDQFVNEKQEPKEKSKDAIKKEIEKDAKKVASEMFDKTRNVEFEYKDGLPSAIQFEITEVDYKLDYDQVLSMDYSENVLKKRAYKVDLKFAKKREEKVSDKVTKYIMKFNIRLTPTEKVAFDVESDYYLVWGFEDKPTDIIDSIKKQKQSCKWEDSSLKILKSSWDKLATAEIRRKIEKAGGIKKRNEKV